jgi:hypothetical protein
VGTDTDNNQLNAAVEEAVVAMLAGMATTMAGNGIEDDDYGGNGDGDSGNGDNDDGIVKAMAVATDDNQLKAAPKETAVAAAA